MTRSNLALATRPPRVPLAVVPQLARSPVVAARSEWDELLHDLGVKPMCLERNAVAHRLCTFAARFVDVATGKVVVGQRDFGLGTVRPFVFDRTWLSTSTYLGPLGHGWHHAYDIALACRGESAAIRFADGRVLGFDAPSRGSESVDAAEGLRLARDAYGFVLLDRGGTEMRFVPHRAQPGCVLGSIRTRIGGELRFGYDHRARLVRITSRGERRVELAYDEADRVIAVCGADALRSGRRIILAQYVYDARGNLEQASDALGQARRYEYERHLLVGVVDRCGSATDFEWDGPDSRARCVRTCVDAGIRERRFEYGLRSTVLRSSRGLERTFEHEGALVRGARGRDASARTGWRFEKGVARTLGATDPLGRPWHMSFDSRGRLTRWVDAAGRVTRYHYRGRWLVAALRSGDRQERFAYDAAGNVASYTAESGATTRYAYDAWNQLVSVTDAAGHAVYCSYDVLGRLVRVQRADGSACELAYDAEGRIVRWKDAARELKFTYQGTGQLSSRTDGGATLCFEYDSDEQLIGLVNEHGQVFRILRDEHGRVVETVGFDGSRRRCVRDALGRVTRVGRSGCYIEYEYDERGRLVEVQASDGAFEGYAYRADGAVTAAWNQETSIGFEYDECDRVCVETQGRWAVMRAHDVAGRRVRLQSSVRLASAVGGEPAGSLRVSPDAVSGSVVSPDAVDGSPVCLDLVVERDSAGRVCRMLERSSGFELRYERDESGRIVRRTLPGGACVTWQRDALGRPCVVRIISANGQNQRETEFEWDASGRIRRVTDSRRGSSDYQYDPRGNVAVRRSSGDGYQLRARDAVGNVYGRDDRRDREYGAAGEIEVRSTSAGEVSCRYDDAGQLVERRDGSERVWCFEWNAAGLLRGVALPDRSNVTFGYDALGRRSWKRHCGRKTRFVWDGARLLHECADGEPVVTWLYDPDDGVPVAKLVGRTAFAVLADRLGAPCDVFDASGQQLWSAETDITGDFYVSGEASVCCLRWPGMYEDLETGLYCHFERGRPSRYYDPAAGTYICQGALAVAPSVRPYVLGYALNVDWGPAGATVVEPGLIGIEAATVGIGSARAAVGSVGASVELAERAVGSVQLEEAPAALVQGAVGSAGAAVDFAGVSAELAEASAGLTDAAAGLTDASAELTDASAGLTDAEVALEDAEVALAGAADGSMWAADGRSLGAPAAAAELEQLVAAAHASTLMPSPVCAWDKKLIPSLGLATRSRAGSTPAFLDNVMLSRERDELMVRVPCVAEREIDETPVIIQPGAEPLLKR